MFITHDRSFLQALATRIVQLDRGQLVSFPGDYKSFLEKREALLSAEAEQNAQFDKKLAQEEVWIRQGIKARRTRNEGRVRALEKLRRERGQRREVLGNVSMKIQEGDRSGKLVVEVENISQAFDGRQLFKDFSTVIQRGDRIGIIGPNGCGKSTLLSILLGRAEPQSGTVRLGTNLQVAYFDQLLVLDEPTNDLDAETLELLEDLLLGFNGTMLLVSHDRSFLNNVVTSCIVFDEDKQVREYVGGYDDWLAQRQQSAKQEKTAAKLESASPAAKPAKKKSSLTYQQQLDLKALPLEIERLEQQIAALTEKMAAADFYQQDANKIKQVQTQITDLEKSLESAFEKWEKLEALQNA